MNPWSKMASDNQAMLKKPLKGLKKQPVDDQIAEDIISKTPADAWWKKDDTNGWESDSPWSKVKK